MEVVNKALGWVVSPNLGFLRQVGPLQVSCLSEYKTGWEHFSTLLAFLEHKAQIKFTDRI